jgi:hypothetical protein
MEVGYTSGKVEVRFELPCLLSSVSKGIESR